ncbi:MAG: hypothetical protein DMF61_07295 [Blastocatellia bacterium AA13]|nr:MAG: hypothetical protein DMF61_07295 [Blastocatellia bacterium AA13]
MNVGAGHQYCEPDWKSLARGLPATKSEFASCIAGALSARGYAHVNSPMPPDYCELIAAELGALMSRSDVKIDKDRETAQEKTRVVKGRPGPYGSAAFGFHTDNIRVDVVSFYCVEQDATDGALLLLDLRDVAERFKQEELNILSGIDLWAPPVTETGAGKEDFFYLAPLLSRGETSCRVYYIPWLLRDSYEKQESELLARFSDYVREKSDAQTIRVPFQRGESVFIDNHRMLHGRAAIAENSRRHLIRIYLSVPSMSCRSLVRRFQSD